MNIQRHTAWIGAFAALTMFALASSAHANTLAYWRFEDGPADTDVLHDGDPGFPNYGEDVVDSSGNGNELSMWETGGGAGFVYRTDVTNSTIPQTGETNNFSMKNTGGGPASYTEPGGVLSTIQPAAWTIEASFKVEDGGHRTIVGRDAQNIVTGSDASAGLYLQVRPGDHMVISFADVSGYSHEAVSAAGMVNRFNFPTDPNGELVGWYNVAAVSDGSTLSLFLDDVDAGGGYQLVAQTDLSLSGSPDTALNNGSTGRTDAGDWGAGDWTVGRGLWGGGHTDRAYGFIDEVRISDSALSPSELLFYGAEQTLSLEVNTTSGAVTLRNDSSEAITLDYYEITSESGALSESGWTSLDSQDIGGAIPGDFNADSKVDAADYTVWRDGLGTTYSPEDYDVWVEHYGQSGGSGDGWIEAGGSDSEILSEMLLDEAGMTLMPGQTLSLGAAYNTAGGADLQLKYGRPDSGLFIGGVTYVSSGASFGAVPEPGTLALLMIALVGSSRRRERR